MGTSDDDWDGENKSRFIDSLNSGKDFGEAFLAQQQRDWLIPKNCLLGAGNLHTQPYVQYGAAHEQDGQSQLMKPRI